MPEIIGTSLTGLLTYQRALATVSHNISNAQTEGYSRQRVTTSARQPELYANGFVGTGVQVTGIDRLYDGFITQQIQTVNTAFSRLDSFYELASRVNNMVADPSVGLTPSIDSFFAAVQDVANDPASIPARQVMLSQAGQVADRFSYLDQRMVDLSNEVNSRLSSLTSEVNTLTNSIAEINTQIVLQTGAAAGAQPNDLLDQRDQLIKELSSRVTVRTTLQDDGSMGVFLEKGQPLVLGDQNFRLGTQQMTTDVRRLQVVYQTDRSSQLIAENVLGGELGGVLEFRSNMLDPSRAALGRVAVALATTFNEQHQRGMDLNGALGGDFFSIADPQALQDVTNTGSSSLSLAYADVGALQNSDYDLRMTSGQWVLTRASDAQRTILGGAGSYQVDGINITIAGAGSEGDNYLLRPTNGLARSFGAAVSNVEEIAAAMPVLGSTSLNNVGNGKIDAGHVVDRAAYETGLATNPLPYTLSFTSPTTYQVLDANGAGVDITGLVTDENGVATGGTYTAGQTLRLNGVEFTLTGSPQSGDVFTLSGNTSGVGDNRNALRMAELQNTNIIAGGTATYQEAYGQLVASVGTTTRQTEINRQANETMLKQAVQTREATSGVNLDEEAANLVRFQQAYQASAQVVSVANSLFQTLLSTFG